MKAMNMKALPVAISLALGAAALVPGIASAAWYIGVGAGQVSYDDDAISSGDIQSVIEDSGGLIDSFRLSTDDSDTGYKIFVGYGLSPYFALEAQYLDLGSFDVEFSGTADDGDGLIDFGGNAGADVTAYGVNAVGILPFLERFAAMAKIGAFHWDADTDLTIAADGTSVFQGSDSDEGVDVNFGVGLKWNITDHIGVQAEWEVYKASPADVDLLSASVSWTF